MRHSPIEIDSSDVDDLLTEAEEYHLMVRAPLDMLKFTPNADSDDEFYDTANCSGYEADEL